MFWGSNLERNWRIQYEWITWRYRNSVTRHQRFQKEFEDRRQIEDSMWSVPWYPSWCIQLLKRWKSVVTTMESQPSWASSTLQRLAGDGFLNWMSWTYLGRWDEQTMEMWIDMHYFHHLQISINFNWVGLEFNGLEAFCCNHLFCKLVGNVPNVEGLWLLVYLDGKTPRQTATLLIVNLRSSVSGARPPHSSILESRRFGLGCPGCLPRTPRNGMILQVHSGKWSLKITPRWKGKLFEPNLHDCVQYMASCTWPLEPPVRTGTTYYY